MASILDRFAVHRARVLVLLASRVGKDKYYVTTDELSAPTVGGHEGPRRVRELRELGYPICATPNGDGYWKYWLQRPGLDLFPIQIDLFPE